MTKRIIEKFTRPGAKKGSKHWNWRGGRKKDTINRYIYIYAPNHPNCNSRRYIREHRLIMEKELGRYLEPWEVVHHKNEIRDDNRIENLELLSDNIENIQKHRGVYRENKELKLKIKELEQRLQLLSI